MKNSDYLTKKIREVVKDIYIPAWLKFLNINIKKDEKK